MRQHPSALISKGISAMIYLYIKQHTITNLKYFGMTQRDPFKYPGSGKYWVRHYRANGGPSYIKTIEIFGFDDTELCSEFALTFSIDNNIIESKEWANLVLEDGRVGGHYGSKLGPRPPETRAKISKSNTGKKHSPESIEKMRAASTGRVVSDETRKKLSIWKEGRVGGRTGKKHTDEFKKMVSETFKGKKLSQEHIEKIRVANSGKKRTKEQCERNAEAQRGRKASDETKKKMSESRKGMVLSAETKAKMSAAKKGVAQKRKDTIVTCPFCSLTKPNSTNMYRYHFDKCRFKPEPT